MRKRKQLTGLVSGLMLALALTGCGASNDSFTNSATADVGYAEESYMESDGFLMNDAVEVESTGAQSTGESGTKADEALANRKLIKTVDMTVETKEFDVLLATLETRVAELGGYIESLETYNGSSYSGYRNNRDANLTIRIPQKQLDNFLDEIGGISNVIRRSENVQDVTLSYVDLESHKKVLEAEQERLIILMEQAENLEDILTIEKRLTDVRYQLESMEAQLRTYDNKINYSTIELYVEEVVELTPVVEKTALQRISDGFVESLQDIGNGLVEFAIWFIVNIPYFILWIFIIIVIILIIKGLKKVFKSGKTKKGAAVGSTGMPQQPNNGQQK